MFKYVLTFVLGAGVGGVTTYFVVKKRIETKCREEQVKTIEEIKQMYVNEPKATTPKIMKADLSEDLGVDPDIKKDYFRISRPTGVSETVEEKKEEPPVTDSGIQPKRLDLDGMPPTAVATFDGYPDTTDLSVEPYLIREQDSGEVFDDIIELHLWDDGVLTSADSYPEKLNARSIARLLPKDWNDWWGWKEDNEDYMAVLWFRNNREKCDVCIVRKAETLTEYLQREWPARVHEVN